MGTPGKLVLLDTTALFADAMQRNGNDLDKTIDGWAGEVAKAKETADKSPDKEVQ